MPQVKRRPARFQSARHREGVAELFEEKKGKEMKRKEKKGKEGRKEEQEEEERLTDIKGNLFKGSAFL